MPLIVHTARLGSPRSRVIGYAGIDAFNVTRGSGGTLGGHFAPSRALLDDGLRGKRLAKGNEAALQASWESYAPRYVEEMRASYAANRGAWNWLLGREVVTLCCYCGTSSRCHRRLLAEILVKLGATDKGERP